MGALYTQGMGLKARLARLFQEKPSAVPQSRLIHLEPSDRSVLTRLVDPDTMRGLEFGPLDRPNVPATSPGIRYIDHLTTEELQKEYAGSGYDVSKLCRVDFISDGRPLPEILGDWRELDYVVAAHVIEHIPNVLGWFHELRAVLREGGLLLLVVPNKRFMFDHIRRPSTLADVLSDFLENRRRPSPRAVLEHQLHACRHLESIAWRGEVPEEEINRIHSDADALATATRVATTDEYFDVHVNCFTPLSFCNILLGLTQLKLLPFALVEIYTNMPTGEFYVVLSACDPHTSIEARVGDWREVSALAPLMEEDHFGDTLAMERRGKSTCSVPQRA